MNDNPCTDSRYPLSALTGRIIAAAEEVPRTLGPGFRELVYQRASAKELPAHRLAHKREVEIDIFYKGKKVARRRVDFVIEDGSGDVMVEIKAKAALEGVDVVQALSYLKASGYGVGLLLNFGSERLQIKRLADNVIHHNRDLYRGGGACPVLDDEYTRSRHLGRSESVPSTD